MILVPSCHDYRKEGTLILSNVWNHLKYQPCEGTQEDSFRKPNPPCTNLIAKLISAINVDNDAG